ncbi:MAG: PilN domain-containing protein [Gammaproteobacteria bacterium]
MPRINLLPWREELRKQKRAEYLGILGVCAVVAVAAWFAVHLYFVELIEYQDQRNGFIKAEIKKLDKKIAEIKALEKERDNLIARMKAIETLQTSRPIIVHLFDELVTTLPEGVYLTEIGQKGKRVTIKGVAQSNARVSNYMRNVEASEWLKEPKLRIIETRTQGNRRVSDFELILRQTSPKADGEDGADDAGDEGEG